MQVRLIRRAYYTFWLGTVMGMLPVFAIIYKTGFWGLLLSYLLFVIGWNLWQSYVWSFGKFNTVFEIKGPDEEKEEE